MPSPRRIASFLTVAAVAVWGGCRMVWFLTPDETKVRRLVESLLDGFNRPDLGTLLDGLAPELHITGSYATSRNALRRDLAGLFLTQRQPGTGRFNMRADLEPDSLRIAIEQDGRASVKLTAHLYHPLPSAETAVPRWTLAVTAVAVERDDAWLIAEASLETLRGSPPR